MSEKELSSNHQANRAILAEQGKETLEIARSGLCKKVNIKEWVLAARDQTKFYLPSDHPEIDVETKLNAPTLSPPVVELRNETTLSAIQRLEDQFGFKGQVCALNFASAKNPGGGVKTGAQAQEESLARASALVLCIQAGPGYAENRRVKNKIYTDHVTYSPKVPVFRNERGKLALSKEQIRFVSFVSSAAPNRSAVTKSHETEVAEALERRIDRTLAIMALHGHRAIVLGAYGCGVFGNDPELVAELFVKFLTKKYNGMFDHVVFAVYSRKGENLAEFEEVLKPMIDASPKPQAKLSEEKQPVESKQPVENKQPVETSGPTKVKSKQPEPVEMPPRDEQKRTAPSPDAAKAKDPTVNVQPIAVNPLLCAKWKERTANTLSRHFKALAHVRPAVLLIGSSLFERFETEAYQRFGSLFVAGVGGDGVQHMRYRLERGLLNACPSVSTIVICSGTNNIEEYNAQQVCEGVTSLVSLVLSQKPAATILVFGLPPRNSNYPKLTNRTLMERVSQFNNLLQRSHQ